jgi:hypothetical protein
MSISILNVIWKLRYRIFLLHYDILFYYSQLSRNSTFILLTMVLSWPISGFIIPNVPLLCIDMWYELWNDINVKPTYRILQLFRLLRTFQLWTWPSNVRFQRCCNPSQSQVFPFPLSHSIFNFFQFRFLRRGVKRHLL